MSLGKKKMLHQAADSGVVNTDNFAPVTYTGNSSTQSISTVGFQPDLVWVKNRDVAVNHYLYDSIRGTGAAKALHSNTTDSESSASTYSVNGGVQSIDTNGFTVFEGTNGTYQGTNKSGNDYVSWCWKAGGAAVSNTDGTITSTVSANTDAGFSIVKWAGNNTAGATIGHGLSLPPEMIIIKNYSQSIGQRWVIGHNNMDSSSPWNYYLEFDTDARAINNSRSFNGTSPTSSVFSVGNDTQVNADNMIAYCFHSVDGYQKVGSYTATSPSISVDVGFSPRFVLLKAADNAGQWLIVDSERGGSSGQDRERLFANLSSAAGSDTTVDFTGNTFSVQFGSVGNQNSGSKYIYLAIA